MMMVKPCVGFTAFMLLFESDTMVLVDALFPGKRYRYFPVVITWECIRYTYLYTFCMQYIGTDVCLICGIIVFLVLFVWTHGLLVFAFWVDFN